MSLSRYSACPAERTQRRFEIQRTATYKVSAVNFINTSATNVAYNAGIGFDYQIAPTVAVRLMAKDYVGKFNFKDATSFDIQGRTAQNWGLTGGIKIGF